MSLLTAVGTLAGCASHDMTDSEARHQAQLYKTHQARHELTSRIQDIRAGRLKVDMPAASSTESDDPPAADAERHCRRCGTVGSIETAGYRPGRASGLGTMAGAAAGVAIGSQIGHGTGRTVSQVTGGLSGASAGRALERRANRVPVYRVQIKMDAGQDRYIRVNSVNDLSRGMRVQVQGGRLTAIR